MPQQRGTVYPKIVERWETKAYALLAFLRHPKPIRRYLYTTNQLEGFAKEVKRRTKVVEVFCSEEAAEKLLYLVLSQLDEVWGTRRLRGFAEILMGSYHADQTIDAILCFFRYWATGDYIAFSEPKDAGIWESEGSFGVG